MQKYEKNADWPHLSSLYFIIRRFWSGKCSVQMGIGVEISNDFFCTSIITTSRGFVRSIKAFAAPFTFWVEGAAI
ncbi:MAG: hypothetical protein J5529_05220 [Prevotella sp.]|nr:hypothetical protein [Prevotella sp.]